MLQEKKAEQTIYQYKQNLSVLTLTTVTSKPDKCKIGAAFASKRFLALLEMTEQKTFH